MKKSALIIVTCLCLLAGCGDKKATDNKSETSVSAAEVEKLEEEAEEAVTLTDEIEQSAKELDELLNELDNIEE